jgi:beta-aspartyl-peptidase (threonine type)
MKQSNFVTRPAAILFGLSGLALMFMAAADAADGDQTDVEIRKVIQAQQDAWNLGDLAGFMNGYDRSDKTTFVSGDEVTRGWQTVLDRYKKKYSDREKMGRLSFSELEITPLAADAAVVLGRWELRRAKDTPRGRFTLIFRRTADGWRIVQDHTSAAAP